jgi:aminoglycoside 3-N-acetyltransferase
MRARIVTKGGLKGAFEELGLGRGDSVAFHTSLSAFGHIEGGADAVIDAIFETIGPEGTALAPTLTFAEEHGPERPPVFCVATTPSVTGQTPEVFRKRPGAVRSLHPTHGWTAIGARAAELTAGHENTLTPCGAGSPLAKLAALSNGRILMLGVDLHSCTFFHYCEEVAQVPYHLQKALTHCVMTDSDGRTVERDYFLHFWGPERKDFTKPEGELLARGLMRTCTVGCGEVRLLDARETGLFMIDLLRRDPCYLLA